MRKIHSISTQAGTTHFGYIASFVSMLTNSQKKGEVLTSVSCFLWRKSPKQVL